MDGLTAAVFAATIHFASSFIVLSHVPYGALTCVHSKVDAFPRLTLLPYDCALEKLDVDILVPRMQEGFPRGYRGSQQRRGRGGERRRGLGGRSTGGRSGNDGMSTDYIRGGGMPDRVAVLDERLDSFLLENDLDQGTDWKSGPRNQFDGRLNLRGLGRKHFYEEDGYAGRVQRGRIPRDLHTIQELGVLVSTLETVAGVIPAPPFLPAPTPLYKAPPRTRPHGYTDADASVPTSASKSVTPEGTSAEHARVSNDDLDTATGAQLKETCKQLGLKVTGKKQELADRISAHRAENAAASATQNKQPAQTHLELVSEDSWTPQARRQDEELQAKGQDRDALEEWAREESEEGSESEAEGAGRGGAVIKYLSTRGHPKARWRGRFRYSVYLLTSAEVLDFASTTARILTCAGAGGSARRFARDSLVQKYLLC